MSHNMKVLLENLFSDDIAKEEAEIEAQTQPERSYVGYVPNIPKPKLEDRPLVEERSERGNRVSFMIKRSSKHSRSHSYHSYRAPSKDGLGDATLASTTAGSFINSLLTGVGTTSSSTNHKHISFKKLEK